jgi:hypothetical protein
MTASRVFPSAMSPALQIGIPVVALTANAATKTAGQSRSPRRLSAASAMPVGGQTALAMPPSASKERPRRAVVA